MNEQEINTTKFYQCRYYNEVIGHLNDFPVPTSQTKDKNKKKEFSKRINELLDRVKTENWPYTDRLTITVGIKGPRNYIQKVDLDNLLKNLFDILKGKVFVDDKQIFSVMAEKQIMEQHGFLIGLRRMKDEEINLCIPPLFSQDPADKIENGKITLWRSIED